MSTENLWGELPLDSTITLPVTILKEQASLLGEMTNKILEAEVVSFRMIESSKVGFDMNIIAPALENYSYNVLDIRHASVFSYPVSLQYRIDLENGWKTIDCEDESSFTIALKEALSSSHIHKIIGQLIAQSNAISATEK